MEKIQDMNIELNKEIEFWKKRQKMKTSGTQPKIPTKFSPTYYIKWKRDQYILRQRRKIGLIKKSQIQKDPGTEYAWTLGHYQKHKPINNSHRRQRDPGQRHQKYFKKMWNKISII